MFTMFFGSKLNIDIFLGYFFFSFTLILMFMLVYTAYNMSFMSNVLNLILVGSVLPKCVLLFNFLNVSPMFYITLITYLMAIIFLMVHSGIMVSILMGNKKIIKVAGYFFYVSPMISFFWLPTLFHYFPDYSEYYSFLLFSFTLSFGMFIFFLLSFKGLMSITSNKSSLEDSEGKPFWAVFLSKMHFLLMILTVVCSGIYSESWILPQCEGLKAFAGCLVVVFTMLYWLQFVIYMKPFCVGEYKKLKSGGVSYMFSIAGMKAGLTICKECFVATGHVVLTAEFGWKGTHGGWNDVSPWRSAELNRMFPEDSTKIWTEIKAFEAIQQRAKGMPHDNMYLPKGETAWSSLMNPNQKK